MAFAYDIAWGNMIMQTEDNKKKHETEPCGVP